jgi:mono/diheme cytochrome c family protein
MTPRVALHVGAAALAAAVSLRAQEPPKLTVADGVYSEAQAVRGAASYDAACARCHRADLTGADGPELRGERFARNFAGKDLKELYTKVATTMPRGAGGSLSDDVYLDIVAHVLRENGFPAGPKEMTAESLADVRVLPGRPKPPPPVGDFSYVEVIGCLTAAPNNTWVLTNASDPVSVALSEESRPQIPGDLASRGLGSQTFHLLDAMAYGPQSIAGHRVYVRGLLIRLPSEQRLTISALQPIAPGCGR